MSALIERPDDHLWILRVRGILKKSDLEAIQSRYAAVVDPDGSTKMLILLEAFEGWERGAAWDDAEFFFTHGDSVKKIAIVGDPRWEVEVMAFLGAGVRTAPVRFFAPMEEAAARAWLA
jgi:hypothetical protein